MSSTRLFAWLLAGTALMACGHQPPKSVPPGLLPAVARPEWPTHTFVGDGFELDLPVNATGRRDVGADFYIWSITEDGVDLGGVYAGFSMCDMPDEHAGERMERLDATGSNTVSWWNGDILAQRVWYLQRDLPESGDSKRGDVPPPPPPFPMTLQVWTVHEPGGVPDRSLRTMATLRARWERGEERR